MDLIKTLIDFILHIDVHLAELIQTYQGWTSAILFLIIFVETGIVIMPFLPGDSLLFAIGASTAKGSFEYWSITTLLLIAAVIGDSLNYAIGKYLGPKVFDRDDSVYLKKSHLMKAHAFYEKYGGKTIIIARFVPIVRTFAPFVAGIGAMRYRDFMTYNVIGAVLWIYSFTTLGYYFGSLPFVEKNFKLVMVAIIILSVLPAVIEFLKERNKKKAA